MDDNVTQYRYLNNASQFAFLEHYRWLFPSELSEVSLKCRGPVV